MPLQLSEAVGPQGNPQLEIGIEIPFRLRLYPPGFPRGGVAEWRTGDLVRTMLEIKVEQGTGRVVGATLVLSATQRAEDIPRQYRDLIPIPGAPMVDLSLFDIVRGRDDPGPLEVLIGPSEILIRFGEPLAPTRRLTLGRVSFYDADLILCGLSISDVTQEEQHLFRSPRYF